MFDDLIQKNKEKLIHTPYLCDFLGGKFDPEGWVRGLHKRTLKEWKKCPYYVKEKQRFPDIIDITCRYADGFNRCLHKARKKFIGKYFNESKNKKNI